MHRLNRLPSPATVLASIALFVSLSGTAIAAGAVPLAKKALFANNAGRLEGKTAAEVAATPGPATTLEGKTLADVAALPGPASTAAPLVTVTTAPFSLDPGAEGPRSVSCPAGTRVVSGGWTTPDTVLGVDSWPSSDATWTVYLVNMPATRAAAGTLYAVCVK